MIMQKQRMTYTGVNIMITVSTFHQVYALMEQSFPLIEYRTYEQQQQLLRDPRYRLLTEYNEQGELTAFLAGWEFEAFRYVENIAVSPHIRGGGIGKRLMQRFMQQSDLPVVLEVELPEDEIKQRRIGFYERLGFHLAQFDYIQPPLRAQQSDLPLYMMSYPAPLTLGQFESVKSQLYRDVYKVPMEVTVEYPL